MRDTHLSKALDNFKQHGSNVSEVLAAIKKDREDEFDIAMFGNSYRTSDGLRLDPSKVMIDGEYDKETRTFKVLRFRYRPNDAGREIIFAPKEITHQSASTQNNELCTCADPAFCPHGGRIDELEVIRKVEAKRKGRRKR